MCVCVRLVVVLRLFVQCGVLVPKKQQHTFVAQRVEHGGGGHGRRKLDKAITLPRAHARALDVAVLVKQRLRVFLVVVLRGVEVNRARCRCAQEPPTTTK